MNEPIPGLIRKQHGALTKMAPAQASDIDLIQQHAQPGATITPEDVLICSAKLAHDQYDRSHERFTKAYLDRFAETLPGKALMQGHNYDSKPSGRWFDANVQQDATGYYLAAKFYVNAKSDLAEEIRLGIAKDVSIGFIPDSRTCDLCSKDFETDCQHWPGTDYEGRKCTLTYSGDTTRVEALEGSLVWLGCQPGAQVMGNSSPLYARKMAFALAAQGESMELKEAQAEIERLKPLAEAGVKYQKTAEKYEEFLRKEIARKTLAKEMASTRNRTAAETATSFVSKMIVNASVEQLETLNEDLDEHLKTVLAPSAKAEGADHVTGTDGETRTATKRQPWEPRTRGDY